MRGSLRSRSSRFITGASRIWWREHFCNFKAYFWRQTFLQILSVNLGNISAQATCTLKIFPSWSCVPTGGSRHGIITPFSEHDPVRSDVHRVL